MPAERKVEEQISVVSEAEVVEILPEPVRLEEKTNDFMIHLTKVFSIAGFIGAICYPVVRKKCAQVFLDSVIPCHQSLPEGLNVARRKDLVRVFVETTATTTFALTLVKILNPVLLSIAMAVFKVEQFGTRSNRHFDGFVERVSESIEKFSRILLRADMNAKVPIETWLRVESIARILPIAVLQFGTILHTKGITRILVSTQAGFVLGDTIAQMEGVKDLERSNFVMALGHNYNRIIDNLAVFAAKSERVRLIGPSQACRMWLGENKTFTVSATFFYYLGFPLISALDYYITHVNGSQMEDGGLKREGTVEHSVAHNLIDLFESCVRFFTRFGEVVDEEVVNVEGGSIGEEISTEAQPKVEELNYDLDNVQVETVSMKEDDQFGPVLSRTSLSSTLIYFFCTVLFCTLVLRIFTFLAVAEELVSTTIVMANQQSENLSVLMQGASEIGETTCREVRMVGERLRIASGEYLTHARSHTTEILRLAQRLMLATFIAFVVFLVGRNFLIGYVFSEMWEIGGLAGLVARVIDSIFIGKNYTGLSVLDTKNQTQRKCVLKRWLSRAKKPVKVFTSSSFPAFLFFLIGFCIYGCSVYPLSSFLTWFDSLPALDKEQVWMADLTNDSHFVSFLLTLATVSLLLVFPAALFAPFSRSAFFFFSLMIGGLTGFSLGIALGTLHPINYAERVVQNARRKKAAKDAMTLAYLSYGSPGKQIIDGVLGQVENERDLIKNLDVLSIGTRLGPRYMLGAFSSIVNLRDGSKRLCVVPTVSGNSLDEYGNMIEERLATGATLLGVNSPVLRIENERRNLFLEPLSSEREVGDTLVHERPTLTAETVLGLFLELFRVLLRSSVAKTVLKANMCAYFVNTCMLDEAFSRGLKNQQLISKSSGEVSFVLILLIMLGIENLGKAFREGALLAKEDRDGKNKLQDWNLTRRVLKIKELLSARKRAKYPIMAHFVIFGLTSPVAFVCTLCVGHILGVGLEWELAMAVGLAYYGPVWICPVAAFLYFTHLLHNPVTGSSHYPLSAAFCSLLFTSQPLTVYSMFKNWEEKTFVKGSSQKEDYTCPSDMKGTYTMELLMPKITDWQPLPTNLVNTRTTLMAACLRNLFLNFPSYKKLTVIGSGRGGVLQGLCHDSKLGVSKARIATFSLVRVRQRLDSRVAKLLEKRECTLEERERYSNSPLADEQLVIFDTFGNPFNEKDEENDPFEDLSKWRNNLTTVFNNMSSGSDFILVTRISKPREFVEQFEFLSMIFKQVVVVVDPVVRGTFCSAILARSKRRISTLELGSLAVDRNLHTRVEEFEDEVTDYLTTLEINVRTGRLNIYDQKFLPELVVSLSQPTKEVKFRSCANEERGNFESVYRGAEDFYPMSEQLSPSFSLERWLGGRKLVEEVIRSTSGAFVIREKLSNGPVPDREHLSGYNVSIAKVLREAGCMPLPKRFIVPGQSNDNVIKGLFKRFDFPSVENATSMCREAIEHLTQHCVSVAEGLDFGVTGWDELLLSANTKSTVGFLSESSAKNVGDMLRNERELLDYTLANYFEPSKVNHLFHLSPKVERVEYDPINPKVPRLFSYKCGETRMVEMALFQKVNDFMADKGKKFPFSYTGTVFDRAETLCSSFEKYENPAAIQIEATKWDGHKEIEWFAAARHFFARVLSAGRNGQLAAEAALRTIWCDGVGTCVSCSGHIVYMMRGSQKSGGWDTGCNNKVVNSFIALQCCANALRVSCKEAMERVTILIEGDDGVIIGETEDVEKILALKDDFYAQCGFPQDASKHMVHAPEDCDFCSMGATRLVPSNFAVPVRSLDEVFGRAVVSLANKAVNPTYENYARSLATVCSAAAMYWADERVRALFRLTRAITPKDVHSRSVHPSEKWSIVNLLGGLDPGTFDLDEWVFQLTGIDDVTTQRYPQRGLNRMGHSSYQSLLKLRAEDIPVRDWISPAQVSNPDIVLWYSLNFSVDRIIEDLTSNGYENGTLVCESHSQVLDLLQDARMNDDWLYDSSNRLLALRKYRCEMLSFNFLEEEHNAKSFCNLSREELKRLKAVAKEYHFNRGTDRRKVILQVGKENCVVHTSQVRRGDFLKLVCFLGAVIILCYFTRKFLRDTTRHVHTSQQAVPVRKGFVVQSKQDGVMTNMRELKTNGIALKLAHAKSGRGVTSMLALAHISERHENFTTDPASLERDFQTLWAYERRFGILVGGSGGENQIYTCYRSDHTNPWFVGGKRPELVRLITEASNKDYSERWQRGEAKQRMKLMAPDQWTFNGAMVTAHEWYGASSYGQLDRVSHFLRKIPMSEGGVVILRISDLYVLEKDGTAGNRYVWPEGIRCCFAKGLLILGESQGSNSRDVARPFGCDINNLPNVTDGVSVNKPLGWKGTAEDQLRKGTGKGAPIDEEGDGPNVDELFVASVRNVTVRERKTIRHREFFGNKTKRMIFVGGPTGPGFSKRRNARLHLYEEVERARDMFERIGIELIYHFNRGHSRLRFDGPDSVGSTFLEKKAFGESVPLENMKQYEYVLVIEGNEAPDRLLTLLSGNCLVLLVKPQFVLSSEAWYQPFVEKEDFVCVSVDLCWDKIYREVERIEKDPVLRKKIIQRGNQLYRTLVEHDGMVHYVRTIISASHAMGTRQALADDDSPNTMKSSGRTTTYYGRLGGEMGKVSSEALNVVEHAFFCYELVFPENKNPLDFMLTSSSLKRFVEAVLDKQKAEWNPILYWGPKCTLLIGFWVEKNRNYFFGNNYILPYAEGAEKVILGTKVQFAYVGGIEPLHELGKYSVSVTGNVGHYSNFHYVIPQNGLGGRCFVPMGDFLYCFFDKELRRPIMLAQNLRDREISFSVNPSLGNFQLVTGARLPQLKPKMKILRKKVNEEYPAIPVDTINGLKIERMYFRVT